jgi:hypothetical protein
VLDSLNREGFLARELRAQLNAVFYSITSNVRCLPKCLLQVPTLVNPPEATLPLLYSHPVPGTLQLSKSSVETFQGNYSRVFREPEHAPRSQNEISKGPGTSPSMCAQACPGRAQDCSPSAQFKAAAAHAQRLK